MVVRIQCTNPDCTKSYALAEEHLGRLLRCKACGTRFRALSPEHVEPEQDRSLVATAIHVDEWEVSPRTEMEGAENEHFGRFVLRGNIGQGAHGTVFRAYDPILDRDIALKVPRDITLPTDQDRRRFLREAKAAAQLRHPNIVPLFDAGWEGNRFYIASAFIDGQTLEDAMVELRKEPRRAVEVAVDLALALAYAHQVGIVHRDLKPANVMIESTGHALLMDFGLARVGDALEKLTQDGAILGTPAYMSPEQADSAVGDVGPASDQYSLGVVLFELLCGERPFSGGTAAGVIFKTISEPAPLLRTKNPSIPRDLETICQKALSKRPEDRYPSCAAMAEDLKRWLEGEPILARRLGLAERLVRWVRTEPRLAAAGIVVALCLACVAILAVLTSRQQYASLQVAEQARLHADQSRVQLEVALKRAESSRAHAEQSEEKMREALARETALKKVAEDALRDYREANARAIAAELNAKSNEKALKEERQRADSVVAQGRAVEYREKLAAASQMLNSNQLVDAEQALFECDPELRDWEWRFLRSRCETCMLTLPWDAVPEEPISRDDQYYLWLENSDWGIVHWPTGKEILRVNANSTAMFVEGPVGPTLALIQPKLNQQTSGAPSKVQLYSLGDGNLFSTIEPKDDVAEIRLHPRAPRLLTRSRFGQVRVWDTDSQKLLVELADRAKRVTVSPDGTRFLVHSAEQSPRLRFHALFDFESGKELARIGNVEVFPSENWRRFAVIESMTEKAQERSNNVLKVMDASLEKEELFSESRRGGFIDAFFSPSEEVLATTNKENQILFWKVPDGDLLFTVNEAWLGNRDYVFSPNGDKFAAIFMAELDGRKRSRRTLGIWELKKPATPVLLAGNHVKCRSPRFSADGSLLAAFEPQGCVVWETGTGKEVLSLRSADYFVWGPMGRACAYANNVGEIWIAGDPTEDRWIKQQSAHETLLSLRFSRDGRYLVTTHPGKRNGNREDGLAKIWNATKGYEGRKVLRHDGAVRDLVFHPEGSTLFTACADSKIRAWDMETSNARATSDRFTSEVRDIGFDYLRDELLVFLKNSTIKLPATSKQLFQSMPPPTATDEIGSADFVPRKNLLATVGTEQVVRLRNMGNGELIAKFAVNTTRGRVCFSSTGTCLVCLLADRAFGLIGVDTKAVQAKRDVDSDILAIAVDESGEWVATTHSDGTTRVWKCPDLSPLGVISCHRGPIRCVAIHPNGRRIVTGGDDGTVVISDPVSLQKLLTLTNHAGPVNAVAISHKGDRIASAGADQEVHVCSIPNVD
ncbi:MAG: protein kinase [Planctomycetota bacterium]